ncbi:MAG: type I restriction enzyme HsdR N-terminal domain-containing protein [Gemmatimonadaceae bacterium]|nr:type I restriction enzyme HsdR N-terminal domain-containing protein [Gemmatimonadaceae bacterium]MCW5826839.1 type I restriction enzyme HsdR N-terminal domain-containing protein [Gemmatimonadaceae bacterium]
MSKIPAKVSSRLAAGLKRFQPILDGARARDVTEADTVTIVKDILAEILGYDKYAEVTSEHAIRGTYCDLAVKLDGKLAWLIEVKSAGLGLKENHVKQAVDYAANQGCEWVTLTNGTRWLVYRVGFGKPIEHTLVAEVDLSLLSPRKDEDLALLWLLSKEGWLKSHLEDFAAQQEALSKYAIGALVCSDSVVGVLRRELRRLNPDTRIDSELIQAVLRTDVLKREILEGEKAESARRSLARVARKAQRVRTEDQPTGVSKATVAAEVTN